MANESKSPKPGLQGVALAVRQGIEARALHKALISTLLEKGVLTKDDVTSIEEMATDVAEEITSKIVETGTASSGSAE